MDQEFGPEREVLVDLGQRRGVLALQPDALPHVLGGVRTLGSLDVEVAAPVVLADRGVPAVGQRARAAVAQTCGKGGKKGEGAGEWGAGWAAAAAAKSTKRINSELGSSERTCHVVLVLTEVLGLGLGPETAVPVHDELPDDLRGGMPRGVS